MKRLDSATWVLLVGLSAVFVACAAKPTQSGVGGGGNGGSSGSVMTGSSSSGGGEGGVNLTTSSGGIDGGMACVMGPPNKDNDGDGYTENEGDCNDCDKNVNPGAVEVITPVAPDGGVPDGGPIGDPVDEDCNEKTDEAPTSCDTGLALTSDDPLDTTKAIGLCKFVKSAKWVLSDGSPIPQDPAKAANFHRGHGILAKFGPNNKPQEGAKMLMLSSGTAREKNSDESIYRSFEKGYTSNHPPSFPKASSACPGVTTGLPHDATGVQIEVNVPTNAQSASFDYQFFTYEWHDYICQQFNDFFVAHVEPYPAGQMDGNVAFDGNGNPISVNNAFINACGCPTNPSGSCMAAGVSFTCALGKTYLVGTPFEVDLADPAWTHGSTGWLRTTMPVKPGTTFRIRLVTYDSTDGKLDSSTLIDNWQWYGTPGATGTIDIPPK